MTPLAYFVIALAFVLGLGVALFLARQAKAQMSEHFKSLALDILHNNSKTFVQIAKGELEKAQSLVAGDLDKRQQAVDNLVKPVRESLDKLDTRIHDLENARVGAYERLTEQVRSLAETQNYLHAETGKLVQALRSLIGITLRSGRPGKNARSAALVSGDQRNTPVRHRVGSCAEVGEWIRSLMRNGGGSPKERNAA